MKSKRYLPLPGNDYQKEIPDLNKQTEAILYALDKTDVDVSFGCGIYTFLKKSIK
jgi:hypothetical protein